MGDWSFAVAAITAAVLVIRWVMQRSDRERAVGGLPMPLADIEPGAVHTAGLVGFTEEPRHAPLGAPPCVFYRIVVESNGAILFEGRSADEITLGDGSTAHVVVHLDGATWRVSRCHEMESSPEAPNDEVVRYLTERGLPSEHAVRIRVEWIAPHELVFVRGTATRETEALARPSEYRSADRAHLEMRATAEQPLIVALEPIPA